MSRCTDSALGAMLHAWELNMLSDEDRQRFEVHLLQCQECAQEAEHFSQTTRLLRQHQQFRFAPNRQPTDRLPSHFESRVVTAWVKRVLLAAAAVAIVAIPVYRIVIAPSDVPPVVQTLNLVPVRGEVSNTVTKVANGDLEIKFYVEGAIANQTYRISVLDQANTPVFVNDNFREFSNSAVGTIVIPMRRFNAGIYALVVKTATDTIQILQQYSFRVK